MYPISNDFLAMFQDDDRPHIARIMKGVSLTLQQGDLNSENGTESPSSTRVRTDFLSITAGIQYTIFQTNQDVRVVQAIYYNSSKQYLSATGFVWRVTQIFTAPSNTAFVRFTFANVSNSSLLPSDVYNPMLGKGTPIKSDRIVKGGLSVNRYCTTGEGAMVGACVAGEANITLDNHDGFFNSTVFVGQEIFIEVGVVDDNNVEQYIPIGYFEIDQSPRKLSQIRITALDRMLFFEQAVDATALSFPCTVSTLLMTICSICGVERGFRLVGDITNESYEITDYPETAQTYRDLLRWICEITGTNAYFRWDGKLMIGWYSDSSAVTLTTANRYDSDTSEEAVSITGVKILVGEDEYVAGTDAYNIEIAQNPFITHDAQAVATALYTAIYPFNYKAFKATVMPMPHLYPMDGLTYVDKDGNSFFCAITDWTFKLNGNTALRGRGQTATQVSVGRTYGVSQNGADLSDAINILRANIIRTAEVINQSMDSLSQELHGEYTALSSQFGQYQQETNAHFEATAEGITQNYDAIQIVQGDIRDLGDTKANNSSVTNINTTVNQHSTYITQTKAKIRTGLLWYDTEHPNGVYGVAIGQVDDVTIVNNNEVMRRTGFYSTYTSEELAFYIGTQKVAYISNNKLFITWANVVDKIDLGRYTIDDDGSRGLTFKWRGNN